MIEVTVIFCYILYCISCK